MNTILERDIDAFIAGNREKILSDIGELVAVPSAEGAPAEGAPFGPGPRAAMMTSELTAIRRTLTPVIERVCRLWLRMHGFACAFSVEWNQINLQDDVEEAKARLYDAQAQKISREDNSDESD